jgi:hypothetical protein
MNDMARLIQMICFGCSNVILWLAAAAIRCLRPPRSLIKVPIDNRRRGTRL